MPTQTTAKYLKPKSEDEFEDIALDALRIRWQDPDAHRHGRRGQSQDGIDIIGHKKEGNCRSYVGAQCKNTDKPTLRMVIDETEKARTFDPPIVDFYFVTSADRDAKLQRDVRQHFEQTPAPFRVLLMFWDDITHEVAVDPNLVRKHWGAFEDDSSNNPEATNADQVIVQHWYRNHHPHGSVFRSAGEGGSPTSTQTGDCCRLPEVLVDNSSEQRWVKNGWLRPISPPPWSSPSSVTYRHEHPQVPRITVWREDGLPPVTLKFRGITDLTRGDIFLEENQHFRRFVLDGEVTVVESEDDPTRFDSMPPGFRPAINYGLVVARRASEEEKAKVMAEIAALPPGVLQQGKRHPQPRPATVRRPPRSRLLKILRSIAEPNGVSAGTFEELTGFLNLGWSTEDVRNLLLELEAGGMLETDPRSYAGSPEGSYAVFVKSPPDAEHRCGPWKCIEFNGRLFAWSGPFETLHERDPDPMDTPTQHNLADELRRRGLVPQYAIDLNGLWIVRETDRSSWFQRVLGGGVGVRQTLTIKPPL